MSEEKVKFTFPSGITFIEGDGGNVICGSCNESFNRIISHLQNSAKCRGTNDICLIKKELNKFKARRSRREYDQKKKKEDNENFKLDQRNRKR